MIHTFALTGQPWVQRHSSNEQCLPPHHRREGPRLVYAPHLSPKTYVSSTEGAYLIRGVPHWQRGGMRLLLLRGDAAAPRRHQPERRELRPGPVDRRVRLAQPARPAGTSRAICLRLPHQRRESPRLAGLASQKPAAATSRMGPLRPVIPGGGGPRRTTGTCQTPRCTCSTPATSRSTSSRHDRGPDPEIPAAPSSSHRRLTNTRTRTPPRQPPAARRAVIEGSSRGRQS